MSNIIIGRTRARSQAIQIIFQAEVQSIDVFDLLEGGDYVLDDGPLVEYAGKLARGVAVNRLAIDRIVGGVSHNWNLSRMPLVDRCVMGVCVYEMFCEEDIPTSVAISEAVELSKVYGTDDSSSFVNGILGRVATLAEANPGLALAQLARLVADDSEADIQATCPEDVPEQGQDALDDASSAPSIAVVEIAEETPAEQPEADEGTPCQDGPDLAAVAAEPENGAE